MVEVKIEHGASSSAQSSQKQKKPKEKSTTQVSGIHWCNLSKKFGLLTIFDEKQFLAGT